MTVMFSSPPEGGNDEVAASSKDVNVNVNSGDADNTSDVPINVPSPILLSSSMVIAIASTGTVTKIISHSPLFAFFLHLDLNCMSFSSRVK